MSAKDDLAEIIYRVNNPHYGDYGTHEETAQAIIDAGWRPPTCECAPGYVVCDDCRARYYPHPRTSGGGR
jgi:hypothetical protein